MSTYIIFQLAQYIIVNVTHWNLTAFYFFTLTKHLYSLFISTDYSNHIIHIYIYLTAEH